MKDFQILCLIDALWASAKHSQSIGGQGKQDAATASVGVMRSPAMVPVFGMCEDTPGNIVRNCCLSIGQQKTLSYIPVWDLYYKNMLERS